MHTGRRRRRTTRIAVIGTALLGAGTLVAATAEAQTDSVTVRAAPRYDAGPFARWLLGSGYRDLWTTPVRVEVLDLDAIAGGLEPLRAGGGHQTRTLHLQGAHGRRWIFRSVDKYVEQALPDDLQRTPLGDLFQDHMSALHPSGALMVPPLLRAAGVLHVEPRLVVMPDHRRLGEHRADFAGMLGIFEERPDEGADGAPGFAGARNVVGMESLLERIDADPDQRHDSRAYLAARLVDFVIGDTDRGSDQWRWARHDQPAGPSLWRPIPRDRDWAFIRSTGVLARGARLVFPKLVAFDEDYPSLKALVFSSIHLDRRLLADLDRPTWDSVAAALRHGMADDVIAEAVRRMPPAHRALEGEAVAAALRARRDRLPDIAARFYAHIATDVDVHGTEAADLAVIDVLDDGGVHVRLLSRTSERIAARVTTAPAPWSAWFDRRFAPAETDEVRIHLGGGDDHAIVRGAAPARITVRIIGGEGDDVLIDSTRVRPAGAGVVLYDADGTNTLVTGPHTRIDTRPFSPPEASDDWVERKVVRERPRDWGGGRSLKPVIDHEEGAGIVVGARWTDTDYGFRHFPWARRHWIEGQFAIGAQRFGVEAGISRPWENSPWRWTARLEASTFDSFRFYGLGNASPAGDHRAARVMQDHVRATGGVMLEAGRGIVLETGLRADYTRPRPAAASPLLENAPFGSHAFAATAAWFEAALDRTDDRTMPRSGFRVAAGGAASPPLLDVQSPFAEAHGTASAYFTFGPTLALRIGGAAARGAFPVQDAPRIGGRRSLRGFRSGRFAGDAAVFGGAELRAPIARVPLLIRGDLGAIAFIDAGRVFLDGDSPGGWHSGYGAGLRFSSMGQTISATIARGEERRINLTFGMPF